MDLLQTFQSIFDDIGLQIEIGQAPSPLDCRMEANRLMELSQYFYLAKVSEYRFKSIQRPFVILPYKGSWF